MIDRSALQLTEGLSQLAAGLRRIHEGERVPNKLSVLLFQVWPRVFGLLTPEERKLLKAALGRLYYGDYDPNTRTWHSDGGTAQRYAGEAATECERLLRQLGNADGANSVDWRDIKARLLRMASSGELYASHADLAKRLDCKKTTIGKAIRSSPTLKAWQSGQAAPRATALNEVVTDIAVQTTETNPAEVLPDDEVQVVFAKLLKDAGPAERARLNAMSHEERRGMAELFQKNYDEPSPLEDDPRTENPHKVKNYKRV